jgi:Family of unknown function (DUF6152)
VRLSIVLTSVALLITALPAFAHHSFAAEYDTTKKVELKGVVTKFEWMNPHAHFYLDVKGPDGKVANWNLELASPNMLVRNGWKRTSLKEGDVVVAVASQAKDGTNTASLTTVTLANGTVLTFMAAPEEPAK